jgi:uncharacterized protein YqgC (DUF456 family)
MRIEFVFALLIMLIGLAGSLLPLLPGPPIIWLGALFYAWQTDFQQVGWITLSLLGLLALAAVTSDFWVGALGQRKAGASVWASLGSAVGGMIGLFVFALPGMLIGSIIGALLPDWKRWREGRHVWNVSLRTLKSWLVSALVQAGLGIVMITIFIVRVIVSQN